MENNKTSTFWKYYGLAAIVLILVLLAFAQNFNKRPKLRHYVVKVNSPIQDDDFQNARKTLENSIFQNTSDAILLNPTLTYSEALDEILPVSENIANPQSGIIVVVQNNGKVPAYNIQIEINLQVPIEKYKTFSKNEMSILSENNSEGILKISVDTINPTDEVTVAILLSNQYPISLTASRTENLKPPVLPTNLDNPMQMIEIMAKQTEVATYNQNNTESLLEFKVEYAIDKIQPVVTISSDEVKSYFYEVQKNKIKEQDLFIETFLK